MDMTTDWYVGSNAFGHIAICHLCRWRTTRVERGSALKALSDHLVTVKHIKRIGRT